MKMALPRAVHPSRLTARLLQLSLSLMKSPPVKPAPAMKIQEAITRGAEGVTVAVAKDSALMRRAAIRLRARVSIVRSVFRAVLLRRSIVMA